ESRSTPRCASTTVCAGPAGRLTRPRARFRWSNRRSLAQRDRSPPIIRRRSTMPVLDRSALVDSPLADLHAIASELSIDGFRRLRRNDLIDAILAKQGGDAPAPAGDDSGDA